MPLIAQVGRTKPGPMILIIGIYVLLIAGSITMVYPFSLMISTAMTNAPDMYEYRIIPRFLYEDEALYRRYLHLRYNTNMTGQGTGAYRKLYIHSTASTYRDEEKGIYIPLASIHTEAAGKRLADMKDFMDQPWIKGQANETVAKASHMSYHYLGTVWTGARGQLWPYWQDYLAVKYGTVATVNKKYNGQYSSMEGVKPPADKPDDPAMPRGVTTLDLDWAEFKGAFLRTTKIDGKVASVRSEDYQGQNLTRFLRPISMATAWRDFLKRKYLRASKLNQAWGLYDEANSLPYQDWDQIRLPQFRPASEKIAADWDAFITKKVPHWYKRRRADAPPRSVMTDDVELKIEEVELDTVDFRWARFLQARYGRTGKDDAEGFHAGYAGKIAKEYELRVLARRIEQYVRRKIAALRSVEKAKGTNAGEIKQMVAEKRSELRSLLEKATRATRLASELKDAGRTGKTANERIMHEMPHIAPFFIQTNAMFDEIKANSAKLDELLAKIEPGLKMSNKRDTISAILRVRLLAAEIDAERRKFVSDRLGKSYDPAADADDAVKAALTAYAAENVEAMLSADRSRYGNWFTTEYLAPMPLVERDKEDFYVRRGELRLYFATCQFGGAFQRLFFHSDAMFNTVWLILLTIITHLTVNPMAAYALSRFNLGYTYKVLLLLLATMAFPPAVAMVPNFLMLKELHLLNTYWALVLPGMANGYAIFLLKGFFDALPKELYEAAEIDGASPINCFVNITFPMSKPIFAINALGSFNWAYTGFMWAFVRCPDPRKWTLMVHVFNTNQGASASVQMAILVIASLPTLLMFLFCQKIILRGIIIPSFK